MRKTPQGSSPAEVGPDQELPMEQAKRRTRLGAATDKLLERPVENQLASQDRLSWLLTPDAWDNSSSSGILRCTVGESETIHALVTGNPSKPAAASAGATLRWSRWAASRRPVTPLADPAYCPNR